jgi:hypothetical protein
VRVLTLEEAQARVLCAQGLSEPFTDPEAAVGACIAVQTQYAMSLPVAAAARTKGQKSDWDERALAAGGSLVKSWTLRHTLHAHAREDHALILGAVGERFYNHYLTRPYWKSVLDVESTEKEILQAIGERPLSRTELHDKVPELKKVDYAGWGMDVMGLAFRGRLCVIGRGSEQKFCAIEAQRFHESAMEELLRRYVRSYGPATLKDFAYWAGVPLGEIRRAFDGIADELEPVEVEGLPGRRYLLRSAEVGSSLPALRLLAKFDPLMMAHADKRMFLREEDRKAVFRKAGQVEATVLIRGRVAGTWRMASKGRRLVVSVEPIRKISKADMGRLEREGLRLAKALGLESAEVSGR